jgi:hypothetical protein
MSSRSSLLTGLLVFLALSIFLLVPMLGVGQRSLVLLENIHGIPFSVQNTSTIITERLAHVDVSLHEPVLAKKLELTITFTPRQVRRLSVGVRENSFWLSYPDQTFYEATMTDTAPTTPRTAHVEIPLTDKLADQDQSIDVMFFADRAAGLTHIDDGPADQTLWTIENLEARTKLTWPTWPQWRDFIRSVVKRERIL